MYVKIRPAPASWLVRAIQDVRARDAERTGLHCSTIVNDIAASYEPAASSPLDTITSMLFQELGNVTEELWARQWRRRFGTWEKPKTRTHRGILCNPDGYDTHSGRLMECKMKWAKAEQFLSVRDRPVALSDLTSTRTFEGEVTAESVAFVKYKLQTLFYMDAWDTLEGELHVLFVTGDGKPPFPRPLEIELFPTLRERRANADMIVQHAKDRGWL